VKVQDKAEEQANQRLVEILVPSPEKQSGFKNPLEMLFGGAQNSSQTSDTQEDGEIEKKRQDVERKLAAGLLEDEIVSIEVTEQQSSM
ncbi:HslU--HslV peptidase ATPase subunit, partial [Xenorhabdus sp. 42]|nr:HslU--HslV peptidase ATPase subunit [Xenorhabdus sp. 42]